MKDGYIVSTVAADRIKPAPGLMQNARLSKRGPSEIVHFTAEIAYRSDRWAVGGKYKDVAPGRIDGAVPSESDQEALNATNLCVAR